MSNEIKDHGITVDQLRELLCFDPETGVFGWAKNWGGKRKGDPAGCLHPHGYVVIQVLGRQHPAHRLAWIHVYGAWPSSELDHINGIRDDNRIANLRAASGTENNGNRRLTEKNKSGFKGVRKKSGRGWEAAIGFKREYFYIGTFRSPEEAGAARAEEARRLFGPFARDK